MGDAARDTSLWAPQTTPRSAAPPLLAGIDFFDVFAQVGFLFSGRASLSLNCSLSLDALELLTANLHFRGKK